VAVTRPAGRLAAVRWVCRRRERGGPARPPGRRGTGRDRRRSNARGQITLALVAMLTALNEQVAVLDAEISRAFAAHPDQHIFASLPRSGTIRAATLLAEIGDCRERFPADDALAALAGACPSTRQSSKRSQAVFRWSCSKKLRAAVMDFANGSRMSDPRAAAIYAAATARGCRHPHAIRILARAWLRIIWRCWQDSTAFDPALHRGRHTAAA
jgi:transposase